MSDIFTQLPKAELHLHLEGAILPKTAAELAEANGVPFLEPGQTLEDLYSYQNLMEFLDVYNKVAATIRTEEDFQRITFEMLENCARSGARHVEFFISPHAHDGVPFAVQFAGIRTGMAQARAAFGMTCLMAPGINREQGPEAAEAYLDECLKYGGDDMVGIGLDYNEAPFPPEPFADVFARARAAGLEVTAHAGESGPAEYVAGSIDALGVRRIDHGYRVMDDPDLVVRCREMGIHFTCCPSTTAATTSHRDLSAADHPIRLMKEAGLKVTIHSDDPPFFATTLAGEYEIAHRDMGFSMQDIKTSILTGIENSWLPKDQRETLARNWAAEIDDLIGE